MSVIAVVNRKGGSGKSTLATHLAAHFANLGVAVMLGDVDRQQSTQSWLRSRSLLDLPKSAPIVGWAVDPKRVLRPPPGVRHVVLDTPGGLRGFDLARVVAFADVILMPVCNSIFDRESAAECFAELMALPRVASGRCKVAAVGMRIDARTRAAEVLEAWARGLKLPFLGVLRETQAYVRCVENGLTVFDLPDAQAQADTAQWKPIVAWLEPILRVARRPQLHGNARVGRPALPQALPALAPAAQPAGAAALRPGQAQAAGRAVDRVPVRAVPAVAEQRELAFAMPTSASTHVAPNAPLAPTPPSAAPEARVDAMPAERVRPATVEPAPAVPAPRLAGLFGWLTAPRFLQRNS